eukprot:363048-Chlamydomonas_euryale.AAC.2
MHSCRRLAPRLHPTPTAAPQSSPTLVLSVLLCQLPHHVLHRQRRKRAHRIEVAASTFAAWHALWHLQSAALGAAGHVDAHAARTGTGALARQRRQLERHVAGQQLPANKHSSSLGGRHRAQLRLERRCLLCRATASGGRATLGVALQERKQLRVLLAAGRRRSGARRAGACRRGGAASAAARLQRRGRRRSGAKRACHAAQHPSSACAMPSQAAGRRQARSHQRQVQWLGVKACTAAAATAARAAVWRQDPGHARRQAAQAAGGWAHLKRLGKLVRSACTFAHRDRGGRRRRGARACVAGAGAAAADRARQHALRQALQQQRVLVLVLQHDAKCGAACVVRVAVGVVHAQVLAGKAVPDDGSQHAVLVEVEHAKRIILARHGRLCGAARRQRHVEHVQRLALERVGGHGVRRRRRRKARRARRHATAQAAVGAAGAAAAGLAADAGAQQSANSADAAKQLAGTVVRVAAAQNARRWGPGHSALRLHHDARDARVLQKLALRALSARTLQARVRKL